MPENNAVETIIENTAETKANGLLLAGVIVSVLLAGCFIVKKRFAKKPADVTPDDNTTKTDKDINKNNEAIDTCEEDKNNTK